MTKKLISLLTACTIALGLLVPVMSTHADQVSGKYRLVLTNGRTVEGDVTEEGDQYVVVERLGTGSITHRVRKSTVRQLVPLDTVDGDGDEVSQAELTRAEIARILGPEENFAIIDEYGETSSNVMEEPPVDEESVLQMMRIAGPKAQRYETKHFVFVHTSDMRKAQELGARLESVYRWNARFMELLNLKPQRPEYKLEMYFFGTNTEYRAYQALDTGSPNVGVLGHYMPPTNRSAFFDMATWPPIADQMERIRDSRIDGREKRRLQNRVDRWVKAYNLEVVQHEAAHHIHFNTNLLPRRAYFTRWLAEGLACMFEAEPTELGAGLGVINHERLQQFRQFIGGTETKSLPTDFMQRFIWSPIIPDFGFPHYSLSWALCHYGWRKDREAFGKFLANYADVDEDEEVSRTDRQRHWEDAFGKLDDDWLREFMAFMNSIPLRTDHLREPWPTAP